MKNSLIDEDLSMNDFFCVFFPQRKFQCRNSTFFSIYATHSLTFLMLDRVNGVMFSVHQILKSEEEIESRKKLLNRPQLTLHTVAKKTSIFFYFVTTSRNNKNNNNIDSLQQPSCYFSHIHRPRTMEGTARLMTTQKIFFLLMIVIWYMLE